MISSRGSYAGVQRQGYVSVEAEPETRELEEVLGAFLFEEGFCLGNESYEDSSGGYGCYGADGVGGGESDGSGQRDMKSQLGPRSLGIDRETSQQQEYAQTSQIPQMVNDGGMLDHGGGGGDGSFVAVHWNTGNKLLAGVAQQPRSANAGCKRKASSTSLSPMAPTTEDEVHFRSGIAKCPRSRNREYIEQLKQEVTDLVVRIRALKEANTSPVKEFERSTCVAAVAKLMTLRFAAVTDMKLWAALVTPEFELQLPAGMLPGLDLLSGPPTGSLRPDGLRVMHGLTQVMQDAAHLQQFLQSILLAFQVQIPGQPTPAQNGFHLIPSVGGKDVILVGDTLMADWTLTVETLADYSFVVTDGMLECKFASDGRIEKLVLIYDLVSLAGKMQEFRRAKVMMQQAATAALQQQQHQQQQQEEQQLPHSISSIFDPSVEDTIF